MGDFNFNLRAANPILCQIEDEHGVPLLNYECPDDTDLTEQGKKACTQCHLLGDEVCRRWNLVGLADRLNRDDSPCKMFRTRQCRTELLLLKFVGVMSQELGLPQIPNPTGLEYLPVIRQLIADNAEMRALLDECRYRERDPETMRLTELGKRIQTSGAMNRQKEAPHGP